MVVLSLMESFKDTASRILPTPYMEVVEEATRPQLNLPQYESVLFLCDRANAMEDSAVDVVRALRRRITDSDTKVQYLTVLLLDALVKNCGLNLHSEIASQKGLLRDLQNIAMLHPCITEKDHKAKQAALALILNLSVWFSGHPDGRLYILTTIADDVRHAIGPNAFEGINPDTNLQINVSMRQAGQPPRRRTSNLDGRSTARSQQQQESMDQRAPIVDAIGIKYPTEQEMAAMLDVCMTLAEYLNNAKVQDDGSVEKDDVICGFEGRIREDHKLVAMMLSSDLVLANRDVLRDISDSQIALFRRLKDATQTNANRETSPKAPETGIAATERYRPPVETSTPHIDAGQATGASLLPSTTETMVRPPMSQIEPVEMGPLGWENKVPSAQTSVSTEASNALHDPFGAPPTEDTTALAECANASKVPMHAEVSSVPQNAQTVATAARENVEDSEQQQQQQQQQQPCSTEDEFDAFLDGQMTK